MNGLDSDQTMLQAILDTIPAATLLVSETGIIRFTNEAARELFFEGVEAKGEDFLRMLSNVAEPLRRALLSDTDQIFTFEEDGASEVYHLSKRTLSLEGGEGLLISVRHMTREIARQENLALKRTLRIVGHELGNSLAPATSLLHSAQLMLEKSGPPEKLAAALATIEERLVHLRTFLGGLAQLGQLPQPRPRKVAWPPFLDGLRALWPALVISPPPAVAGWFDAGQIQQVLINLVKNAYEAGGPPGGVELVVGCEADAGVRCSVLDRGAGMTDEVMKNAFVFSFTTKAKGGGMGLALCREIVESHQGRLRLGRREGGGTEVSFWLPPQLSTVTKQPRLTLTTRA